MLKFIVPLMVSLLSMSSAALASECDFFETYKPIDTPDSSTKAQRVELLSKNWKNLEKIAQNIFDAYLGGQTFKKDPSMCLEEPNRTTYRFLARSVFYESTVRFFKENKSAKLRRFSDALVSKSFEVSGRPPLFLLLDTSDRGSSSLQKGGFHRGKSSLYLNNLAVPSQEWFVFFIHEMVHYIDDRLKDSTDLVSDFNFTSRVRNAAKRADTVEDYTENELLNTNELLQAGLDRGLLAEWRAWSVTGALYQEGRRTGQWEAIPWLDKLLEAEDVRKPEALNSLFAKLKESFPQKEGLMFQSNGAQEALDLLVESHSSETSVLQKNRMQFNWAFEL